ncbi:MAG: four helix bundle protein [Hyphomonadaceae bacterium]|nr:four helix bundle protein [Hyphomonadaceae bacterium]
MLGQIRSFRDLQVYQRAYSTSLDVHRASLRFPKVEQFAIADQMRRASKSICANIAEGFGRQRASSAEFRRFLTIATGSCDEMQVWSQYAQDLGYITAETAETWGREYVDLAKMLRGLSSGWK